MTPKNMLIPRLLTSPSSSTQRHQGFMVSAWKTKKHLRKSLGVNLLGGGFLNPFEKYAQVKMGIMSPIFGVKTTNIWNHRTQDVKSHWGQLALFAGALVNATIVACDSLMKKKNIHITTTLEKISTKINISKSLSWHSPWTKNGFNKWMFPSWSSGHPAWQPNRCLVFASIHQCHEAQKGHTSTEVLPLAMGKRAGPWLVRV